MSTLLALLRATWRSGIRGLLGLALIIGVAAGAVLSGAGAARRTDSAFDRLLEDTAAWDILVNPDLGTESALRMEDIAALPMVVDAARLDGVLLAPRILESFEDMDTGPITMAGDGRWGYEIARPLVREGRMPDPEAIDEIFVSDEAADALDLEVGDRYAARVLTFDDFGPIEDLPSEEEALAAFNAPGVGQPIDLTVVGTGQQFDEIVVDEGFGGGSLLLTPAFYAAFDRPSAGYWGSVVRLRSAEDLDQFQQAVEALAPDEPIAFQSRVGVEDQFNRAIRPQVVALWIFSALAAVFALIVVGQAISRSLQVDAVGLAPLGALGVTRGQRTLLGVTRVAIAAAAGTVLAVAITVVASPLGPIGVARDAEPDPGVRADPAVLVLGGIAVLLVFTALAVRPALRSARRRDRGAARSGPGSWAAGLGLGPSTVAGVRFALDRSAVGIPARSTLVGAVSSVALVVATVAFSASLDHFVETAALFGTPWDAVLDVEGGLDDAEAADFQAVGDALVGRDDVHAFGILYPGQLRVEGRPLAAIAIEPSERPVMPTMLAGRPPTNPTEVALGATTMDDLNVEIGDAVTVTRRGRTDELTVVGTAVLPAIGSYSGADKTTLGEGVLATPATLAEWGPEFIPYGVVVEMSDADTTVDELVADIEVPPPLFVSALPASVPSDVKSLEQVRSTPALLTGLLAALIALTVIHALGAAVRSRRREIAVLRTLGFTRRQVLGTVSTQAALIAAVGLLLGVPVGLVVGRVAWTMLTDRLGAALVLVTPVLGLVLLSVAVVALALVVGLVPGVRAARSHPAETLRTE